MRVTPIGLPGLALVEIRRFGDDRGWFAETFNARAFEVGLAAAGLPPAGPMAQDNQSASGAGVLRGLHYQLPPSAQGKLVRVVRGAIFDVTVDIRPASPSYGRWFGIELSAETGNQLWVPAGFAHGFQVIGDGAEVIYKATDFYAPTLERSIRWDDPAIGIAWHAGSAPRLAPKDRDAPPLSDRHAELLANPFLL